MPTYMPESNIPNLPDQQASGYKTPTNTNDRTVPSPQAALEYKDQPAYTDQFSYDPIRKAAIVEMVLLDATTDEDSMKPYLERIRECIKLYEQERGTKAEPFPGASNVTAGDVPIAVENMHPRLFGAVMTDPLANFRAENSPSIRNLNNVTRFMNWAFRIDMLDFMEKLDEHVHSAIMAGTQVSYIFWDRVRNVYRDWELDSSGSEQFKRKVELLERGGVYNMNIEDFLVPITEGRDIHLMSHNIRRYYLTVAEIKESIARKLFQDPNFDLDAQVDELMKNTDSELVTRLQSAGFTLPQIRNRKRLEILEWHGLYDAEREGFRSECTFTIIRSLKTYLSGRYQPSPDGKRPFEATWLIPRKNFFYGIGIPEMIRLLAQERDAIHNQRIDAGSVSIIPFGFYRAASGFKPDKITLQPGSWLPLDDIRDASFAQFSNPSTILASEEAMTQGQIEKLSIAGSFQLGRESEIFKSRATARGTQLVVGQGNIRFNLLGERVKRGVSKIMNRLTALYQAYLPPNLAERVLGDDGKKLFPEGITRQELRGRYHAYLTGDTETSNKSYERQISVTIYQAMVENPLVQRSPARLWEITADMLKSFNRDVRRIIGTRPPDTGDPLEAVSMMLEDIKQGFAPEIPSQGDFIAIISGLSQFKASDEYDKLDMGKRHLVDDAISVARTRMVKMITQAIQARAQQAQQQAGSQGQPQGNPQEQFIGSEEVPSGAPMAPPDQSLSAPGGF